MKEVKNNGGVPPLQEVRKIAKNFAEDFISELKNGNFKKEHLPNNGQIIDNDYIQKRLASYDKLVDSKLFNGIYD